MGDLVEVLSKSDKFKALSDAIKVSGLIELLSSDCPYTIFAPTDSAFARAPRSSIDELLNDEQKLRKTLLGHVIVGKLDSSAITRELKNRNTLEVKTLCGGKIVFRINGILNRYIAINGATLVSADLPASNGIIHTIDRLLLKNSQKDAN